MKYLKIQNKGVIPMSLFFLMGASTKSEDPTSFGEFGTGLKYAISYCARTSTPLIVFLGTKELTFSIKELTIRKSKFNCIYINNRSTNITTKFGETWEAWMAIREIWCNAKDEINPSKEEVLEEASTVGKAGYTTFYIGITEEIQKVVDKWDEHFLTRTDILYEDDDIIIYPSDSKALRIYKNSILIYKEGGKCLFHYDLKKAKINELREYKGSISQDIPTKLLASNEKVVEILMGQMNRSCRNSTTSKIFETNLDYYMWSFMREEKYIEKVKELFSGKLYISNRSSNDSKHGVMVSDSLLTTLEKCGLKTLTVHYSSGYGYGGSLSADYELLPHPRLQERLERHLKGLELNFSFDTMTPVNGSDCDFVYKDGKIIFNVRLEHVDDRELQAIILSAYTLEKDKNYVTLKRLIKGVLNNRKRLKTLLQL